MESSVTKAVSLPLTALAFFIIVTSTLAAESISHAFLIHKPHTFDAIHLLVVSATAILAAPLIMVLFLRARKRTAPTKSQEQDLLRAKEDWEKTFNAMTDFVSVHDKNFKIIKANRALCEFLNKTPGEIIGKLCYQVFHNMDEPYNNCPHKKTSEIDHPVTEIINDPNIGLPLQITCSPFFDNASVFQGSLHVARVSEEVDNRRKKTGQIFPICASCKSIRSGDNEWLAPEEYFLKKHNFQFTHTFCRNCQEKLYPDFIKI